MASRVPPPRGCERMRLLLILGIKKVQVKLSVDVSSTNRQLGNRHRTIRTKAIDGQNYKRGGH
jgi:hypothetical protein